LRIILLLFFSSTLSLFAQAPFKSTHQIYWTSDTSIELSFQTTNFKKEQLANLKIVNNSSRYEQFQFAIDSVFIGKGISIFKKEFVLSNISIDPYEDTLSFTVNVLAVKDNSEITSGNYFVLPKKMVWSIVIVTDSSITIPFKSNNITYNVSSSESTDSLSRNNLFKIDTDTVIQRQLIIKNDPITKRKLEITQINASNKKIATTIWYKEGKFYEKQPLIPSIDSLMATEKKALTISGAINLETNFFSDRPQHSNGSQYPFNSIQANNTVSVFGIPFILSASHNTNDNISPNFRNFFSLQFDSDGFRKNMEDQLIEKLKQNEYTPIKLKQQLYENDLALEKLRNYENLARSYNIEEIEIDSLLAKEFNQVQTSIEVDSILNLDSLTSKTNISGDTMYEQSNYRTLDSLSDSSTQKLAKIQSAIKQLEKSNELKKKHLNNLQAIDASPQIKQINSNELFSRFESGSLNSILLRFNKLDIGNFYEYTGEYSIRDVELEGVNLSFLINKSNSLSVLHGKVNDFQSFNLDDITDRKKISSLGWNNSKYSFFKPTMRVTRVADETVNPEISNTVDEYFITSLNAEGEVSSWANYVIEYNTSSTAINPLRKSDNQESKNSAYFLKTYITPLPFLDVKLQFDRVGSNYRSDGVYFLNRNFQAYTIGGKIRLFKNKIHLKNDFTIQERNFEQKELTNRTQKQFYDFGTHFKRLPNLQVSYSPISIEVANRIDTSFSGINANTNVLIARIFYFKKIKKTLISTALVYNQIENELADDFSTQKGIQHFASISNEKTNFSFTSSYEDDFSAIRFVSASFAQKIGKKLQFNTHAAKNFRNDFYSEIIRTGFNLQLNDRFNLGAGGIFLIERATSILNSGGSVSLRINY
jgi:hypothetical protein